MSKSTQEIRQKLEKLLAKAQSSYELGLIDEANTYSDMATALALKYSVDVASLSASNPGSYVTEHSDVIMGPFTKQKAVLLMSVCEFHGCALLLKHTFYEQKERRTYTRPTSGGYTSGSHISIFGRPELIDTALGSYTLYGVQLTQQLAQHGYTGLDAKSFIAGFSATLSRRLAKIKEQVSIDVPGTDLVLRSAHDESMALLRRLYATKDTTTRYDVNHAAISGAIAAENVDLGIKAVSHNQDWTRTK